MCNMLTVTPSIRSALLPKSFFASDVLMTFMVCSVGSRAVSASRPFVMRCPSEIIHFRSGIEAGESDTTKSVPFQRYRRSKMVQPMEIQLGSECDTQRYTLTWNMTNYGCLGYVPFVPYKLCGR
jgi:hypothetical protein